MDRAAFAAGHGRPVGKTPVARSAPSRSEGAAPRVCSLWLLSLAQARESDSAARMADETHRDVSRSSRNTQKAKSRTVGQGPPYEVAQASDSTARKAGETRGNVSRL